MDHPTDALPRHQTVPPLARLRSSALRDFDVDRGALARHGLVLLAAMIPLQRATVIGAVGSVVSLIAVGVVPLALWAGWTGGARRTLLSTPLVFAVALAWWAGATTFWSVDPTTTASNFFRLLPMIAMALAFLSLSSERVVRLRILQAYVLGSVAASSLVVWQYLTTPAAQRFSVGPDASINQVAFTLVLALVPAAYLLARTLRNADGIGARGQHWRLLAHGACFSIIFAAVLLSGSRSSALLSAIATLIAIGLIGKAARTPLGVVEGVAALLLLSVALVSALSLTDAPPFERLVARDGAGLQEEARTRLVAQAWTMSAEQPVLGAGLGTGVTPEFPSYADEGRNPHNTHMQVFLELGAVGSLLWLLLLVKTLSAARRRPVLEQLMWIGQLGILFVGIGARGFIFGVPMWLFLGVVSASDDAPLTNDDTPGQEAQ